MAKLDNARHEAFCQSRVTGVTVDEAYVTAGFKQNHGNAFRLNSNETVLARIAELQVLSAAKAIVTAAELSDQLEEMRLKAIDAGQFGAAVNATMGRAKLHGLIIDKAQVEDVTPVKPEVRQAEIDRLLNKRHLRVVGG